MENYENLIIVGHCSPVSQITSVSNLLRLPFHRAIQDLQHSINKEKKEEKKRFSDFSDFETSRVFMSRQVNEL